MNPRIASLQDRMAKGGDWRSFRDEITALHETAKTEHEYVTLLEAHKNLVAVGQYAFDQETYEKLLPITAAEYRMFLSKEAMENGLINPVLLESITSREVEAERLAPDDEFRKLAAAGASVLGGSREVTARRRRKGEMSMSIRETLRIANGIFWLWMCLSAALTPVISKTDNFWAAKAAQLLSLNPNIQDVPRFIGNAAFPLMLWFVFDRLFKPKAKAKPQPATERADG